MCDKTRDEEHDFVGCKCKVCGRAKLSGHSWGADTCTICGLKLNDLDGQGLALLHRAVMHGTLTDVEELVAAGANLEVRDKSGCTPLLYSLESRAVAQFLFDVGANPLAVHANKGSLLQHLWSNRGEQIMDFASLTLPMVPNVDAPNSEGETPIRSAVRMMSPVAVCILLANGANPNQVDNKGHGLLTTAATLTNLSTESGVAEVGGKGTDLGPFYGIETLAILTHWRPEWQYRSDRFQTYNCSQCGAKHSQIEISLQPALAMVNSPAAKDSHLAALEVAGSPFWSCPGCKAPNAYPAEFGR